MTQKGKEEGLQFLLDLKLSKDNYPSNIISITFNSYYYLYFDLGVICSFINIIIYLLLFTTTNNNNGHNL